MSVTEIENYRELILENIEYDCLKQRYPLYLDDLNEIVELLVETVCAKRKTTRISGADFPHEIVRSRFLKLDTLLSAVSANSRDENTSLPSGVYPPNVILELPIFNARIMTGQSLESTRSTFPAAAGFTFVYRLRCRRRQRL